jgi:hypothetical protein
LNHRPLGYEPSRAMLTHCDSIGPSASPFEKMPTPTPGFGAKLVPSCKELAGVCLSSLPKNVRKFRKFGKIKSRRPLPKAGCVVRRDFGGTQPSARVWTAHSIVFIAIFGTSTGNDLIFQWHHALVSARLADSQSPHGRPKISERLARSHQAGSGRNVASVGAEVVQRGALPLRSKPGTQQQESQPLPSLD